MVGSESFVVQNGCLNKSRIKGFIRPIGLIPHNFKDTFKSIIDHSETVTSTLVKLIVQYQHKLAYYYFL